MNIEDPAPLFAAPDFFCHALSSPAAQNAPAAEAAGAKGGCDI